MEAGRTGLVAPVQLRTMKRDIHMGYTEAMADLANDEKKAREEKEEQPA